MGPDDEFVGTNEAGVNSEAKLKAFYCQPMASVRMNYSFPVQHMQRKQVHDSHPCCSVKEGTFVVHDRLICAL